MKTLNINSEVLSHAIDGLSNVNADLYRNSNNAKS